MAWLDDNATFKRIELEKLYLGRTMTVSHLLGTQVDVREVLQRGIEYSVRGFLWSRTIESYELKWPANWKEAFKERWFPRWALTRWPVRYYERRICLKAVWPTLKVEVPDHSPRLVMMVNNDSVGSWPPEGWEK